MSKQGSKETGFIDTERLVMRDTIFISHATPADNDFSIWIASRLEMLGYKVWIDKEGLLGGERFWATIQKALDHSIKVLFVYSKNIVTTDGILRQGIEDELEYAKSISVQNRLQDFIIPLHIDDSNYNLAIGLPNINHIPFNNNWADGLKQLLKKLEKDNIPCNLDNQKSSFSEWYENEYISNCSIIPHKERYYTSWWTIAEMPDRFFMYQFANAAQAKAIRDLNREIPISLLSNCISSFDGNMNFFVQRDNETIEIRPEHTFTFSLTDILDGFSSDKFPQHRDVENHFKRLIYCVIANLFRRTGLWKHEMSNKRLAYFLPKYDKITKVKFTYPASTRKKAKALLGEMRGAGFWHYGVSLQPTLFPFIGFSLKSHLLFTSDGMQLIEDEKKQHSFRRKKGKGLFNEAWRDLFLAFIQRLKNKNGEISIQVTMQGEQFTMKEWPEMFISEKGYIDPNAKMSVDKIEDYYEDLTAEEIND